ncbi:hypothetical protein OAO86_01720 [Euryarchaeota archaeon]|nr:hypothetical protein [Euryarchaeota archaeon]MDC0623830.1 hypothetical protein [Euryarchaeota archaeon]
MSQLKPMIIVMLMMTSALAGCIGDDTTNLEQQIEDLLQSNEEMSDTIDRSYHNRSEVETHIDGYVTM